MSAAGGRAGYGLSLAGIGAAFVLGLVLSHGCLDDRARVAAGVFACNAGSTVADRDCGSGFVCYTAAQSLGSSICVPRCDPSQPASCPGVCTAAGECLRRCTVKERGSCPANLICVRTTISPLESGANDGVCLPVGATCASSQQCSSAIFNRCSSEITNPSGLAQIETSGSICTQGFCAERSTSCQPGSSCLRRVLPSTIAAPDICSADCLSRLTPDGQSVFECAVGFTCLTDAFPQTQVRVCAPGFTGWLCIDDLGCMVGRCFGWSDVSADMAAFRTCSPRCNSDDDCVLYDRGSNPNFITKFTCRGGRCRNLQSLGFAELCNHRTEPCILDGQANCVEPSVDAGVPPDGGTDGGVAPDPCGPLNLGTPLGAFGGQSGVCVRSCTQDSDCATLNAGSHVPHTCAGPAGSKRCVPTLPLFTECSDTRTCMGDLTCEPAPPSLVGAPPKVCTRRCNSTADCGGDAALGSAFACFGNLCIPKTRSGCAPPAPLPELCLSGLASGGRCVSPPGWVCDSASQCASGSCPRDRCR